MAGAHVTWMVPAVLLHGPGHLRTILDDLHFFFGAWQVDSWER
jgi:hypothetical protein